MASTSKLLGALTAPLIAIALVTACTTPGPVTTGETDDVDWLGEYGLEGLDPREIIERLETLPVEERPEELMASIRTDALVLSDDAGNETFLDLPEDEFYISVAPYTDRTHDCHFHSLTTCLGELRNQDVDITVTDTTDGTVLLDGTVRTHDNGFAGIWLPRDIDATLTVEHADKTASIPVSTTDEDPTCVTTLHLT
ncbi:CueP family metal-binding protein [Streptomyces calidiresistens]|uniref:CueP family metal-binding protein n=1 Tax=Streptomyces calidiresistens TaxID=1485586 RepID=UPI002B1EB3E5|nr:CueP family metal-binding protein [Streptomyces calidiresistens]